jgi:hypothetical protein
MTITAEQSKELFDTPDVWELTFITRPSNPRCVDRLPRESESLRGRRQHAQDASPGTGAAPGAANALLIVSHRLYAPAARRPGGHDTGGAEWPGLGVRVVRRLRRPAGLERARARLSARQVWRAKDAVGDGVINKHWEEENAHA